MKPYQAAHSAALFPRRWLMRPRPRKPTIIIAPVETFGRPMKERWMPCRWIGPQDQLLVD
jgi:hypothetical protein